ncbi:hypothetical protein F4814DRAFT_410428 [Daldinia grandis]|nr:hypothetical protein F4814DRAFT_410428 [Daldinia grandis]
MIGSSLIAYQPDLMLYRCIQRPAFTIQASKHPKHLIVCMSCTDLIALGNAPKSPRMRCHSFYSSSVCRGGYLTSGLTPME